MCSLAEVAPAAFSARRRLESRGEKIQEPFEVQPLQDGPEKLGVTEDRLRVPCVSMYCSGAGRHVRGVRLHCTMHPKTFSVKVQKEIARKGACHAESVWTCHRLQTNEVAMRCVVLRASSGVVPGRLLGLEIGVSMYGSVVCSTLWDAWRNEQDIVAAMETLVAAVRMF